jgi:hypothetical protein
VEGAFDLGDPHRGEDRAGRPPGADFLLGAHPTAVVKRLVGRRPAQVFVAPFSDPILPGRATHRLSRRRGTGFRSGAFRDVAGEGLVEAEETVRIVPLLDAQQAVETIMA